MSSRETYILYAPKASSEELATLREEFKKSLSDANYNMVVSNPFSIIRIENLRWYVFSLEGAYEAEIKLFKELLEEARQGKEYVITTSYPVICHKLREA